MKQVTNPLDKISQLSAPERVKAYAETEELNLAGLGLQVLPPEVRRFQRLKVLLLRHNQLNALPDWLAEFTSLRVLDLDNNPFTEFPAVVAQLEHLEELSFGENRCTHLSEAILELQSLRVLSLAKFYPPIKYDPHPRSIPTSVPFSALPENIGALQNLEYLDLANNPLSLPSSIGELRHLKVLSLRHHQLKVFPEEISPLHQLRLLDISDNQLTELPGKALLAFKKLEVLDASSNQLKVVPPEMSRLKVLNYLDLSHNQLEHLPPSFVNLSYIPFKKYLKYRILSLLGFRRRWQSYIATHWLNAEQQLVGIQLAQHHTRHLLEQVWPQELVPYLKTIDLHGNQFQPGSVDGFNFVGIKSAYNN